MCGSSDVRRAVPAGNGGPAAELRAALAARQVTAVNLLSSPGSGKTALLEVILRRARARGLSVAALTADPATGDDARRLARSGVPVRQVLTGGLCHLDSARLRDLVDGWLPEGTRVLFVENVGNLVCPASYDLGETLRIALMSVTEGEDKPLKYPTAFGAANLVLLTKTDIAEAVGFDAAAFTASVERVNPGVEVLSTSARTGQGVDTIIDRILTVAGGSAPHAPVLAEEHLRGHAPGPGPAGGPGTERPRGHDGVHPGRGREEDPGHEHGPGPGLAPSPA